jgi:AcrR family transcriptional regulator
MTDGGIDEVRIARVARIAGVSTALVHYHFSTRELLLAEALEASFQVAGEVRLSTKYGTGPVVERLRRKVEESLPYPGRRVSEWGLWVELWLRAVREPGLRPVAARLYERYRRWMAALILAGTESGEFRSDVDVDAVADVAMALLDGTGVRALIDDPAMDVEAARTLVAERLATELGIEAAALAQ